MENTIICKCLNLCFKHFIYSSTCACAFTRALGCASSTYVSACRPIPGLLILGGKRETLFSVYLRIFKSLNLMSPNLMIILVR